MSVSSGKVCARLRVPKKLTKKGWLRDLYTVQRSAKVLVHGLVKFVPASLARAGTNFTKPRTKTLADLCISRSCIVFLNFTVIDRAAWRSWKDVGKAVCHRSGKSAAQVKARDPVNSSRCCGAAWSLPNMTSANTELRFLAHSYKKNIYRDGLKTGPVLLSNSQAMQGRKFSQPRNHFSAHLCICVKSVKGS